MILNLLSQQMIVNRTVFNPKNKDHLKEYKYFIENNSWKNVCPFWLEWPYLSVPDMIKDKMIKSMLTID
jgi:hypothetical protein